MFQSSLVICVGSSFQYLEAATLDEFAAKLQQDISKTAYGLATLILREEKLHVRLLILGPNETIAQGLSHLQGMVHYQFSAHLIKIIPEWNAIFLPDHSKSTFAGQYAEAEFLVDHWRNVGLRNSKLYSYVSAEGSTIRFRPVSVNKEHQQTLN